MIQRKYEIALVFVFEDLWIFSKWFIHVYELKLTNINFWLELIQPFMFCKTQEAYFEAIALKYMIGLDLAKLITCVFLDNICQDPRAISLLEEILGVLNTHINFMISNAWHVHI